jgi:hypothetical protein
MHAEVAVPEARNRLRRNGRSSGLDANSTATRPSNSWTLRGAKLLSRSHFRQLHKPYRRVEHRRERPQAFQDQSFDEVKASESIGYGSSSTMLYRPRDRDACSLQWNAA